ncbi:uncharacterized protein LOC130985173 isoform X1 [Salvia miltiorrhiza]|uniref:uncharacterized protein LOC130985173 isoform X1 n=1 Tax=Salvia miltiorrhiza TaxID=226208 RepID=UPI0025ACC156|nr:uncharacterized protein LOC130985173 isoform X1 [Salvia miltiorrhiza]
MGEIEIQHPFSLPPPPLPPLPPSSSSRDDSAPPEPSSRDDPSPPSAPPFDPSRMIGIIKRKALIKELAAAYHAECLTYCQELLELQKKNDEASDFHNARNISVLFSAFRALFIIYSFCLYVTMDVYMMIYYSREG